MNRCSQIPKAVVCHAGSRDHYQVAWALSEAGLLDGLVTDFYLDPKATTMLRRLVAMQPKLANRCCPGLRPEQVRTTGSTMLASLLQKALPNRARQVRLDRQIGREARRLAIRGDSALLSYSYYASTAFAEGYDRPRNRILFQLHPHPASVRQLLRDELERVPQAAKSLRWEHELGSSEEHWQSLCNEPSLATAWFAASRYTAKTLAENGVPEADIHVIPYGVDINAFHARATPPPRSGPLRLAWVGSVIQRKGLSYLLEALAGFPPVSVELLIYTHAFVDDDLIKHYRPRNVVIHQRLSRQELVSQLHQAHVFVLPSLSEGFGHVIIEAMSTGLPVITTPNTGGLDLISEGRSGFIVPIRDTRALAERIEWCLDNPGQLFEMGQAAAETARRFTWPRFRKQLRDEYAACFSGTGAPNA